MHQKSEANNQLIEGVNEAVSSFYYNSKNKDRGTTSSRYSIEVQNSAGRKDTLMKPAKDVNK